MYVCIYIYYIYIYIKKHGLKYIYGLTQSFPFGFGTTQFLWRAL